MLKSTLWFLVVATMLAGCQFGGGDPEVIWDDPAEQTMREKLIRAHTLELDLTDSSVKVSGRTLPIEWGRVRLRAGEDGKLWLENIDVRVGTVSFSKAELPPNGLELRDVRVSLAGKPVAAAEWTSADDAAFTSLALDLELGWAFVTHDGSVAPLAPQVIKDVQVDLAVYMGDDGKMTSLVTGRRDGTFFEWGGGYVQLKDLVVDLKTRESGPSS